MNIWNHKSSSCLKHLKTRWVKSGDLPYGNNTILFTCTSSINGLSMAKGFLPPPTPQLRSTQPSRWRTSWVLAARTSPSPVENYWCGLQNGLSEDGCPKNGDSNVKTYDQPCFFGGTLFPDKPTWSNDHLNLRRPVWFVIPSHGFFKARLIVLVITIIEVGALVPPSLWRKMPLLFQPTTVATS